MTSITVGLDEALVARLAERAKREGVTVEELASRASVLSAEWTFCAR